jgi:uncharacterized protein YbjT (DUF2867 family)
MITGKTAFVFGASGLVGNLLVKELINDPAYSKVVVFVRKPLVIVNPKVAEVSLSELEHFDNEEILMTSSQVFCCVGTTIKTAGSQEEFRKVDYELPVKIGAWAKSKGVNVFVAISSIGANAASGNFYLRTKGEMEEGLKSFQFSNLIIVRPSMLLGTRREFRMGEELAKVFSGLMNLVLFGSLKKYRAIKAIKVARAMKALANSDAGEVIYESDKLEELGK